MNRRKARETAFIAIFSASFGPISAREALDSLIESDDVEPDIFCRQLVKAYDDNNVFIDEKIRPNLKGWELERLSRVSIASLRIAIAEMYFAGDNPSGVSINEAVELAKRYGEESDYQFVNGVLSAVLKEMEESQEAGEDGTD